MLENLKGYAICLSKNRNQNKYTINTWLSYAVHELFIR